MNGKSMVSLSVAAVLMAVLLPVAALLTGCSEDGNPVIPGTGGKDDLLVATLIENTCFVSTVSNLEQGAATNERAIETVEKPGVFLFGDMVFIAEGMFGDMIYRYDRAGGGELTPAGALTMPPGSAPVKMAFVSATKAYVCLMQAGKLVVINPTAMTITKEIDLSSYAVEDNNPDPNDMVIRDGKLFVALSQSTSMFSVVPSAYVLVLDVATDTVERVISDERTGGAGTYLGFPGGMFVDDTGDLYVYGNGMHGYQPGLKDGFLRIRSGESEFDPGYLFSIMDTSLPGVPGNTGMAVFGMVYTGGSAGYGFISIPGLLSDPPDYARDRSFQPFKIDLSAGTAEKLALNPTPGFAHGVCRYRDKVVFGLSSVDGDGLYTVDLSTGAVSGKPVVTTVGMPFGVWAF
jgi:hypothetical protein